MWPWIIAGVVAAGAAVKAVFDDEEEASDDVGDDRAEAEAEARARALKRRRVRKEKEIVNFARTGLAQLLRDHGEVLAVTPELEASCAAVEFGAISGALGQGLGQGFVWATYLCNDDGTPARKVLGLAHGNAARGLAFGGGVGDVPEADAAVARHARMAVLEKDLKEITAVLKQLRSLGETQA